MGGCLRDGNAGDGDPRGLAEHDPAAPQERGDVPGHGAAGHGVGRPQDADHLGVRNPRVLQQPPQRREHPERLQRRLRAAPVGGAVDQSQRDRGQTAGLGVQCKLAGIRRPALGVPRAGRRGKVAVTGVAHHGDGADWDDPRAGQVEQGLVRVPRPEPDAFLDTGQDPGGPGVRPGSPGGRRVERLQDGQFDGSAAAAVTHRSGP